MNSVFFLGSHPALSAAELAAFAQRTEWGVRWDLSRLPVALLGEGHPRPRVEMQRHLGGTTMIGSLRATLPRFPTPEDLLDAVAEITQPRQGKRLVGLSALVCFGGAERSMKNGELKSTPLAASVRSLAMSLKRALGLKGTRVVFPAARRPDLSTAQLLHNKLPREGTAIFLLAREDNVDVVTIDTIQDIEAYARRDRGRPYADPGRGMLPPKVAQILLNLSLVPRGGTVYDPFCGVGTIPMEALLMGLPVVASDASPTQVGRTRENISWLLSRSLHAVDLKHQVFAQDIRKGIPALPPQSVDAIVTEGWLGPARTTPPPPREADEIFSRSGALVQQLLSSMKAVVRDQARTVIALPAFRVGKRVLHFPLERVRLAGWKREPLVAAEWQAHPLFRESHRGTLLYGRPDAIVLREIVRFRRP